MTDNDKAIVWVVKKHLVKLRQNKCYIDFTDRKLEDKYKAYEDRMKKAYDTLKVTNPDIVVNILTHPVFFLNEQCRYADDLHAVLKALGRTKPSAKLNKATDSWRNYNTMLDWIDGK